MGAGSRALLSGFVAFVVTSIVVAMGSAGDRESGVDAVTIGGLVGGVVALGVWVAANRER